MAEANKTLPYTGYTLICKKQERREGTNPLRVLLLHLDSERHFKARSEPIGVEQLAGAVQEEAQVSAGRINQPGQIEEFFRSEALPDIIGLSLPLGSLELALEVINFIQEKTKNQKKLPLIVLGGYIPTWSCDEHLKELLKKYQNMIAVRSGGESPLIEIIKRVKNNKNFENIPGVVYLDPQKELQQTPPNADFNTILNPRLTDHYLHLPGDMTGIVGSYGCPHNRCTFCTRPPEDKGKTNCWRGRDPNLYIEDLKRLYLYIKKTTKAGHPIRIFFPDEEYISEKNIPEIEERIRAWNQAIEEEKNKPEDEQQLGVMEFEISIRADTIVALFQSGKIEILESLKKLGLRRVFIGFESAIPENFSRWDNLSIPGQLKRYGKGCSPETQLLGIRILEQLGFDIELGTIFFDSLVDLGELYENFFFLKQNNLIPYAATPFSELRIQEGSNMEGLIKVYLKRIGQDPEQFLGEDYHPSTMTKSCRYLHPLVEKIINLVRKENERNYRAKRILKQAARSGTYDHPGEQENLGWLTLSKLAEAEIDFILNLISLIKDTLNKKQINLSQYDLLTDQFESLLEESGLLKNHQETLIRIWEEHLEKDQSPIKGQIEKSLDKTVA